MSPPIWLKDQNFNDKKNVKTSQIRNYSSSGAQKSNSKSHVVSDLLAELQDVLCENAKLQSQNSSLRTEVTDLRSTNDKLIEAIHTSKVEFEKDLNKLQDDIEKNENNLLNNSKKCLLQQKRHVQEIEELKVENENLKIEITKQATDSTEKIRNLENEIKLLQLSYNTAQNQNEENTLKSTKYKNKLKYAITIINELNSMLVQHTTKSECYTRETQTEDEGSSSMQELDKSQSNIAPQQHRSRNIASENLILSDIFFKSKAFCENELLMFNENGSLHTFDDSLCQ